MASEIKMNFDVEDEAKQESPSDNAIMDMPNALPMEAGSLDDDGEDDEFLNTGSPTRIEDINFSNIDAFLRQEEDDDLY